MTVPNDDRLINNGDRSVNQAEPLDVLLVHHGSRLLEVLETLLAYPGSLAAETGAQVVGRPLAGHWANLESPSAFSWHLREFYSRVIGVSMPQDELDKLYSVQQTPVI